MKHHLFCECELDVWNPCAEHQGSVSNTSGSSAYALGVTTVRQDFRASVAAAAGVDVNNVIIYTITEKGQAGLDHRRGRRFSIEVSACVDAILSLSCVLSVSSSSLSPPPPTPQPMCHCLLSSPAPPPSALLSSPSFLPPLPPPHPLLLYLLCVFVRVFLF
jgi:hypothetical protein